MTAAPNTRARRGPGSIYDLDRGALEALLGDEPAYRVEQLWDGLYRQGLPLTDITTLPVALRHDLGHLGDSALRVVTTSVADDGRTRKWLFALDDGNRIETVLMDYGDRATVCVSTQAGCAMACGFCATGQAGFARNLTTGEIVEQLLVARRVADRRVSNVVFMGMGEPLANYDRTWAAIERMHGAVGISARQLTVSTVGVVPGIDRLASEDLPVGLAVSLHAADDATRDALVPLNRRYPLAELIAACERYVAATGRRLSLEWALIDGCNDRDHDARALAGIARALRAHVNLIPLNPTPGYPAVGSPGPIVRRFRELLRSLGVNVTIRHTRGRAIDAACGQLRAISASDPGPATR